MVADAVEGFATEIERCERDVGSPLGVVVTARDIGAQRIFAGVSAGAVSAVVAERDGLGKGNIEPECTRDGGGDLCNFECMRESRSLMIIRKDEDLGLAGEATEGRGMQDAVAVALEARPKRVRCFLAGADARADGSRGGRAEQVVLVVFALFAMDETVRAGGGNGVGVGETDAVAGMSEGVSPHGGCPQRGSRVVVTHERNDT